MTIAALSRLLIDINEKKTSEFGGIGLIVYNTLETLTVIDLHPTNSLYQLPQKNYKDILSILTEVSISSHPLHDGFHLLSQEFELTALSQYFSTPIISNVDIQGDYGSRYHTAIYGSLLSSVKFTGLIGTSYGPTIFHKGKLIDPLSLASS